MNCRIDIKGRKIWVDDNNTHNTRPPTIEIILYRDGKIYKTVTLDSDGDGSYKFPCLIVWKNKTEKYIYTVDERDVPDGYYKTIREHNIINTLNNVIINGTKTWVDDNNDDNARPQNITVRLFQNGNELELLQIDTSDDTVNTVNYTFGTRPFVDPKGVPYIYTIKEDPVEDYKTDINGFNITNTYDPPIIPFSFSKTSILTGTSLQGAHFEIRKNGIVTATAVSGADGTVNFLISGTGTFLMTETESPAGYLSDITIYEIVVASDGTITVDGQPASDFNIKNQPEPYGLTLQRATNEISNYKSAPNTWQLHGIITPDLYMTDKILILPQVAPVSVKWDYGVKTVSYFLTGGYDISGSYNNGIPVSANGDYTVYVRFSNGYETVKTISIDRIRNGSAAMPYLIIDFTTAVNLEPLVNGIGQFVLDFMQGDGEKLTLNYEIYENIEMSGRKWIPLGEPTGKPFTGTLYGNGNDINNLTIVSTAGSVYNTGMFGRVGGGGVIENLGLVNCNVQNTSTSGSAAGFVGTVTTNNGIAIVLKDLRFSGSVASSSHSAGGIAADVGAANGTVLIDGCSVDAIVSGSTCGGVAGSCSITADAGEVSITNCRTAGTLTGTGNVGGILGGASVYGEGKIKTENCINTMKVQSSATAGGIVGNVSSFKGGIVSSCCNLGEITGVHYVGGIAGYLESSTSTAPTIMKNCYNIARITVNATTSAYAGGLLGMGRNAITIISSYNTGSITTSTSGTQNNVGGISGNYGVIDSCAAINALCSSPQSSIARISQVTNLSSQSMLNNNRAFVNMQVLLSGVQKSPLDIGSTGTDGINISSAEIKTQTVYEDSLGWDFTDVWSFGNDAYTLPILRAIPLSLQPTVLPIHL